MSLLLSNSRLKSHQLEEICWFTLVIKCVLLPECRSGHKSESQPLSVCCSGAHMVLGEEMLDQTPKECLTNGECIFWSANDLISPQFGVLSSTSLRNPSSSSLEEVSSSACSSVGTTLCLWLIVPPLQTIDFALALLRRYWCRKMPEVQRAEFWSFLNIPHILIS